ncbi:hypothetical protein FB45DRAFT_997050 [Roridomyces roridus]|uniref:Protein kinase domain-containing protein n=1 Tax=Roridomyces roridus TaxID=1738132 RepID=A0AAD7CI66_9AGAR|nr:hypothetical protein FB45DRAFT_997050 [Roridomyces roridus]
MSFISNASGITLGEGTFNNVQGNLVNMYFHEGQRLGANIGALLGSLLGDKRRRSEDSTNTEEPARKRRRQNAEEDELEVIRHKDLDLTHEIGGGPGYLLHAGNIKRRAVIVKVFNAGTSARKHLEATVNLSQRLLHPNVLRIEAVSSPTSIHHFIAYDNEDAQRRTAEGPLAAALRDDLDKSIVLGFKMARVLGRSGINYLNTQGVALPLGPENFDVFLDISDRFLLSINPPAEDQEQDDTRSVWTLFNALCQKVLRSANRLLHDEDIERIPTVFDSSPRSPPISKSSPVPSSDQAIVENAETIPTDREEVSPVPPRREYVWRTMDVPQSLASIATQISRDLDLRRASINRLTGRDTGSIHRCPGYIREEVTLATRTADSAVVSHDAPTIQEVCLVCHEIVDSGAVLRCICGDAYPGWRPTVKCQSCKFWSHRQCVRNISEFLCHLCVPTVNDYTAYGPGGSVSPYQGIDPGPVYPSTPYAYPSSPYSSPYISANPNLEPDYFHPDDDDGLPGTSSSAQRRMPRSRSGSPMLDPDTFAAAMRAWGGDEDERQRQSEQYTDISLDFPPTPPSDRRSPTDEIFMPHQPWDTTATGSKRAHGDDFTVEEFFTDMKKRRVGPSYNPRMAERLHSYRHEPTPLNPRSVSLDIRTPEELAAVQDFLTTRGRDISDTSGGSSFFRESYFDPVNLSQLGLAGMPAVHGVDDERFYAVFPDARPSPQQPFRSEPSPAAQMGSFKHQSPRSRDRDTDRERLRKLSLKYDRDRLRDLGLRNKRRAMLETVDTGVVRSTHSEGLGRQG